MTAEELLPCPFCGGEAERSIGRKGDGARWEYIECSCCAGMAEVDMWNRRSASTRAAALREAAAVAQDYKDTPIGACHGSTIAKRILALLTHLPAAPEAKGEALRTLLQEARDELPGVEDKGEYKECERCGKRRDYGARIIHADDCLFARIDAALAADKAEAAKPMKAGRIER